MATKKQKEELIQVLKFTPITATIRIQGYGGECYAGKASREDYEFFKENKYDLNEYASDWDGKWDNLVPAERQPFPPGSAFECDGLFHASGAEMSDMNLLEVENTNTNETIWQIAPGYSELVDAGVDVDEYGGTDFDDLDEGTVVFWGGQGEKGLFFEAEFTLNAPFDPKKLKIGYENCDGWYIINYVVYDGEELDGSNAYSTTGKWADNKWVIVGGEEVYDAVPLDERDDYDPDADIDEGFDWSPLKDEPAVTDWFEKNVSPAYVGTYEAVIDAPWPLSGVRMIEWTGSDWAEDGNKIAIVKWRGLAEDPNI